MITIKLRRSVQVWIIVILGIMVGNIGVFRFAHVAGAVTAAANRMAGANS